MYPSTAQIIPGVLAASANSSELRRKWGHAYRNIPSALFFLPDLAFFVEKHRVRSCTGNGLIEENGERFASTLLQKIIAIPHSTTFRGMGIYYMVRDKENNKSFSISDSVHLRYGTMLAHLYNQLIKLIQHLVRNTIYFTEKRYHAGYLSRI